MKKGFTLIELLAVIVILAIIVLIAIPVITNMVEEARKSSSESSAYGYIDAVEKHVIVNKLKNIDDIKTGIYYIDELTKKGVTVKGTMPTEGWLYIKNSEVVDYSFKIRGYYINKNNKGKLYASKIGEILDPTPSISINTPSQHFVYVGETLTLTITENRIDVPIVWSSSNDSIATVINGVVTGVGIGDATITVTAGELSDSVTLKSKYSFENATVAYSTTTLNNLDAATPSRPDTYAFYKYPVVNGVIDNSKKPDVCYLTAPEASESCMNSSAVGYSMGQVNGFCSYSNLLRKCLGAGVTCASLSSTENDCENSYVRLTAKSSGRVSVYDKVHKISIATS